MNKKAILGLGALLLGAGYQAIFNSETPKREPPHKEQISEEQHRTGTLQHAKYSKYDSFSKTFGPSVDVLCEENELKKEARKALDYHIFNENDTEQFLKEMQEITFDYNTNKDISTLVMKGQGITNPGMIIEGKDHTKYFAPFTWEIKFEAQNNSITQFEYSEKPMVEDCWLIERGMRAKITYQENPLWFFSNTLDKGLMFEREDDKVTGKTLQKLYDEAVKQILE